MTESWWVEVRAERRVEVRVGLDDEADVRDRLPGLDAGGELEARAGPDELGGDADRLSRAS